MQKILAGTTIEQNGVVGLGSLLLCLQVQYLFKILSKLNTLDLSLVPPTLHSVSYSNFIFIVNMLPSFCQRETQIAMPQAQTFY